MEIKRFTVNPLQENCYALCDSGECAIIDCGALTESEWATIKAWIDAHGGVLKYVLQTHMHFDHIFGLRYADRDYKVKALCHSADVYNYTYANKQISSMLGIEIEIGLPALGGSLTDGQKLQLGTTTIDVIHTPGHTPGGLCFYFSQENVVFSGDTLFQGSLGRADLDGGDMLTEIASIRERLLVLPESTRVLPGHGEETTIGYESKYNMYVR